MKQLLTLKEVIAIVGLSKATIYRMINKGEFPDSKKLGARTVRWENVEIQNWIDSLSIQREGV